MNAETIDNLMTRTQDAALALIESKRAIGRELSVRTSRNTFTTGKIVAVALNRIKVRRTLGGATCHALFDVTLECGTAKRLRKFTVKRI